jgi:hypothetical protein
MAWAVVRPPTSPAVGLEWIVDKEKMFADARRNLSRLLLCLAIAGFPYSSVSVASVEKGSQGEEILLDTYRGSTARLESNDFGLPLFLESSQRDSRVQVEVYGILDHAFGNVAKVLQAPENWCDIVALHPNVKACTHREGSGDSLLTLYVGRKGYQPPEDTRQVLYRFRTAERRTGYLRITLDADEGPYGTRDHRMVFEAVSLEARRTFVRVSYSYDDSAAFRLVQNIYFATLGRGKVGFTVAEEDEDGKPIYIGGPRGALERTAVRYYFAIRSFMDSLSQKENARFEHRINEWFDLTARYRRQLYDLDKKDYLAGKLRERNNQVALQRRVGVAIQ